MKFAAVVILYHPCEKTLTNINSYYDHVDKVYVFDNTEKGSELKYSLLSLPKISYHHDGQNEGIASRLNAAARMALDDGFDWLLMMDQDSGFSSTMMEHYLACVRNNQFHHEVAMFGVNFEEQLQPAESPCSAVFSNELITSGTLLNLSLFLVIGFF
jgi:rhamnosyltransferase